MVVQIAPDFKSFSFLIILNYFRYGFSVCKDALIDYFTLQMDSAPRRVVGEVTVVDLCTPEGSNVTYDLAVLEELQTVFSPEMAHASYIPLYCLIGKINLILC